MEVARTMYQETLGINSRFVHPEISQQGSMNQHQNQQPDTSRLSLLSRLPAELLMTIFSSIGETQSLENLCIATNSDARVYEIALVVRWKRVTIDDRDLIPAPGRDTKGFILRNRKLAEKGLNQSWNPVGLHVFELLADVKRNRCGANYVQELIIDLRMQRYNTYDWGVSGSDELKYMPSLVSLKYTLAILAPRLKNIRSVECRGDLPQEILDTIIALDTAKIWSLSLRHYNGIGKLRDDTFLPSEMHNLGRFPLKFEELAVLGHLRTLSIHRLTSFEVPTLLLLVPKLKRLESLSLIDNVVEHRRGVGFNKCAIQMLLASILTEPDHTASFRIQHNNNFSIFPPSLKSLTLWDNGRGQDWPELEVPAGYSLATSVTNLKLCFSDLSYAAKFISSFPKPQIRNLTVSGGVIAGSSFRTFLEINDIVKDHVSTLERVRLPQAWQCDAELINRFNNQLIDRFSVQELVLGWRNDYWHPNSPERPTLTHYLTDNGSEMGLRGLRWGNKLKRLRIDFIDLEDREFMVLKQPSYSNLRVIMLQPFCRKKIDIKLPELTPEQALERATDIMENTHSALKIIIIQSHWFYVHLDTTNTRVICPWYDIAPNSAQQNSIQNLLSDADWAFMTCSSPLFWDERQYVSKTKQRVSAFFDSSQFKDLYCTDYMTVLRER